MYSRERRSRREWKAMKQAPWLVVASLRTDFPMLGLHQRSSNSASRRESCRVSGVNIFGEPRIGHNSLVDTLGTR